MASSSADTLSYWERLPDELLLRVIEYVMRRDGRRRWCGSLRGVGRRWRALHDVACTRLGLRNGLTDGMMHALCARLPALTHLNLAGVESLTEDGLRAVGGLPALVNLNLSHCNVTDAVLQELRGCTALTVLETSHCVDVTDAGLWELRDLTALIMLSLRGCFNVTDVGLQHLTSLAALLELELLGTSTTKTGRDALKAAIPVLTIHWR